MTLYIATIDGKQSKPLPESEAIEWLHSLMLTDNKLNNLGIMFMYGYTSGMLKAVENS